jgi:hypothetical protein
MAVPVTVTFHRLSQVRWIEKDIRRRGERLGRYCPRLRRCRVVIDVPHRHHLQGNRVRLHVDLDVPGEPLAVTRDAPLAASRLELARVIRESFDVARRCLQDYSRRQLEREAPPMEREASAERKTRGAPASPGSETTRRGTRVPRAGMAGPMPLRSGR